MHPMPLPHFLLLIAAVILAGALTVFIALHQGISLPALGLVALVAAALVRMMARVE